MPAGRCECTRRAEQTLGTQRHGDERRPYTVGLVSKERDPFPDLTPGLLFMDAGAQAINDAASDDLYIAAIAAYDFAAAERREKKLLWMTKISCPSRGLALPETLPAMLAIAGPNIGRETAKPVWVKATDQFKPEVKIGDPSVVEYLDTKQRPIFEALAASAKKSTPGGSETETLARIFRTAA